MGLRAEEHGFIWSQLNTCNSIGKSEPLVSFKQEWGENSSLLAGSERSPHCTHSFSLKMVLKLLVESALMFCLINAQWFVLSNKYAAYPLYVLCVQLSASPSLWFQLRALFLALSHEFWGCASAVLNASFHFCSPVKASPAPSLALVGQWEPLRPSQSQLWVPAPVLSSWANPSAPRALGSRLFCGAQCWVGGIALLLSGHREGTKRVPAQQTQLHYWHFTKTTPLPDGSHWLLLFCNSCPFVNCFYCLYILFRLPFFL